MKIIKVEVRGGVVQDVSNIPAGIAVSVWDWDNIKEGDPEPGEDDFDYSGEPALNSDAETQDRHGPQLDAVTLAVDALRACGSSKARKAIIALTEAF